MIELANVVGGYPNKPIIQGVNLTIEKGEFFALLGPNGSGKTTLFRLITGQLPLLDGSISIDTQSLLALSKLEKAKKLAVLTQEATATFDYTVEEIVQLGRYPHQKGFLKMLSKKDRQLVEDAMAMTNVTNHRNARFRLLSGGEKQRVLLAKALAQEPEVLLLDEPTNHLDIHHTFQMLDQLKAWQREKGLTIFAILHDLNVASLYADRIALLHQGRFLKVGDVQTLRNEEQLKTVYNVQVTTRSHPTVPKPQILMTPNNSAELADQPLAQMYTVEQTTEAFVMHFERPLRAISNAFSDEGFQWIQRIGWSADTLPHHDMTFLTAVDTVCIRHSTVDCYDDGVHIASCYDREKNALHLIILLEGALSEVELIKAFHMVTEALSCVFYGSDLAISQSELTIAVCPTKQSRLSMDRLSETIYTAAEQTKAALSKPMEGRT